VISPTRPLLAAGVVLGMAFAAFFDGIVLHQLLGWHHMICQETHCDPVSIPDLQRKQVADGWFHLGAYALTLIGTVLLFRAGRRAAAFWSGRYFAGSLLTGYGLFNLVEGVIDHHILRIHHVRFGPSRDIYDLTFLAVSALILGAGVGLVRSVRGGEDAATAPARAPRAAGT
jgi:uncharacterized membrane protein